MLCFRWQKWIPKTAATCWGMTSTSTCRGTGQVTARRRGSWSAGCWPGGSDAQATPNGGRHLCCYNKLIIKSAPLIIQPDSLEVRNRLWLGLYIQVALVRFFFGVDCCQVVIGNDDFVFLPAQLFLTVLGRQQLHSLSVVFSSLLHIFFSQSHAFLCKC